MNGPAAVCAVLLVALAAGCGTGEATEAEPGAPTGSWQLTSGSGPDGEIRTPDPHRITLVFDEGEVGGVAACNSYGGPVELDGDRIELGALAQTEMACAPPVMAAESAYLDALQRVETLRREGDGLVLAGPSVELRFDLLPPVPTRQLLDTVWELDTVIVGEVASSVLEPRATLRLESGGALRGETGCRSFAGRYAVAGDEIRVTELAVDEAATAGVCAPAAAEQERVVLEVVGDGFRAEVDGDRLTLTDRGGSALVYRAR